MACGSTTLALERSPEKRLGGCDIPLGPEQEIDGLALFVDRSIEVGPAAFDLHVDPMREVDGDRRSLAEWDCNHALWRMAMPNTIHNDIGAIFVSLELCQEPSWTENMELRFDLAINSENFS